MTGSEIVLIRHGETEWSRDLRHTGLTDVPLTDEGRRQAAALGVPLAGRDFALVLTSPLGRALETSRLAGLAGAAQVREDLGEWDYGDYEGLTTLEIRERRPEWWLWRDGCPGGEDPAQVGGRVDRVLSEARAADGNCALIAHGHVLRVLAARWIGLGAADGARFGLSTATVSVLGWERDTPVLSLWNDAGHLAVSGRDGL